MNMSLLDILHDGPVVPVIVIDRVEDAVPVARALVAGGVRVLEFTLRTRVALKAIERVVREVDGAIVGVGTLLRPQDLSDAVDVGAAFGVSPGLTPALCEAASNSRIALLPGVMTPSDVMVARGAGFTALKLFPAQPAGGVGMLKALHGPFPDLRFCPTGGITADNAADFLDLPNVACVGGSWLVPRDAVARADWAAITELASAALKLRRRPSPNR
jgi:2-dehydro-3-deoxyphosphogluconate aldolase/(4S)-4-hydroxy-2-oxoglutarate aldolase